MARVTVEDCVDKVENRFELVAIAAHRAKKISSGAHITVPRDNDKDSVIALREIAARNIDPNLIKEDLIISMQKRVKHDQMDDAEQEDQIISHVDEELEFVSDYVLPDDNLDQDDFEGVSFDDEILDNDD